VQGSNGGGNDVFVTRLSASGTSAVFSTYLGGSGADQANGIALDLSGNAYLVGTTASTNFPVTSGAYKTSFTAGSWAASFAAKPSSAGDALLYSPLFGNGSTTANAIAVDSAGSAYITGTDTAPTAFPTTSGAFQTTSSASQTSF